MEKEEDKIIVQTNEFQTPITQAFLDSMPKDVCDEFMNIITNIPFVKRMISPTRKRAKDLPRDAQGRIIVDVTDPHILEDMDYFRPAARFYEENGCYTFLKPNKNKGSEFQKWFQEEKRRCLEGYVRVSDGEWVTGFMYFYLNYAQIKLNRQSEKTGVWHQIQHLPDFWEGVYYGFHALLQARLQGKHLIELARRGASKAHPYSEKVITPQGERTWGDIQVGDYLFGDDGLPTKVIDIPFDGVCDTYKITLRDGREVLASDEHLWRVLVHHHAKEETLSTKELLAIYKRQRYSGVRNPSGIEYVCGIPVNKPVDFAFRNTEVDPYTFGVMLGDGVFTHNSCCLSENSADMEIMRQYIPYEVRSWKSKYGHYVGIRHWHKILKHYDLDGAKSDSKFIPYEYKFNSREVRMEVLRGLMDTDGYLGKHDVYTISTVSKRLAEDIRWLCFSLGYNNSMTKQKAGYKKNGVYIQCKDNYVVSIYTTDPIVHLPRKRRGDWPCTYAKSRAVQSRIVNIEYVGKCQSKCVTVDSKSHCYLIGDFVTTHNSYRIASIMIHNLVLGEDAEFTTDVNSILTAYTKEYLSEKDGTLSKFEIMRSYLALNTEFKRAMLKAAPSEMVWRQGYKDAMGISHSTNNIVMGLSVKDDESKVRGKRGMIFFEEMGAFPNLKDVYMNVMDSVKDGDNVFAELYLVGTAGDEESDFSGAKLLLYNPQSFGLLSFDNVWSFPSKSTDKFGFFFPAYISRSGCMDHDGNSDVVKAIRAILMSLDEVKQSGDMGAYLKRKAELCITPEDALLKVKANYFPVPEINERLRQLDSSPHIYDDVHVGVLVETGGKVVFRATDDVPIHKWKVDNTTPGALEIFEMPVEGKDGNAMANRYILGNDPVDNDKAESASLSSTFVFDLATDRIVAEYTGRKDYAEQNYLMLYNLARFYNGKILYEANKKGTYTYFAKKNATWMLADCPEYLKARNLIKYSTFGSAQKGVTVNAGVKALGYELINNWLQSTYTVDVKDETGHVHQEQQAMLFTIRNRALLEEMVSFTPGDNQNYDRLAALSQVMLYREQFVILYGGYNDNDTSKAAYNDPFLDADWKRYQERHKNNR